MRIWYCHTNSNTYTYLTSFHNIHQYPRKIFNVQSTLVTYRFRRCMTWGLTLDEWRAGPIAQYRSIDSNKGFTYQVGLPRMNQISVPVENHHASHNWISKLSHHKPFKKMCCDWLAAQNISYFEFCNRDAIGLLQRSMWWLGHCISSIIKTKLSDEMTGRPQNAAQRRNS